MALLNMGFAVYIILWIFITAYMGDLALGLRAFGIRRCTTILIANIFALILLMPVFVTSALSGYTIGMGACFIISLCVNGSSLFLFQKLKRINGGS